MDLKPTIWISSIKHLELCDQIMENTPSWKKLFGHYKVPEDFPWIKVDFSSKKPSIFFSRGEITIKNDSLLYNAFEGKNNFLNSYHNLDNDLSFVLNHSSIKSIEWYPYKIAYIRRVKWKWIRITCNEEILGGDFLIRVDGATNTENLFEMLSQFKEGHAVSASLNDFSNSKMHIVSYVGIVLFSIYFILDLIVTMTYGTINEGNWGPSIVGLLLAAFILIFTSMIWYVINAKESSKINYQGQLFFLIFWALMMLNLIKDHFYP